MPTGTEGYRKAEVTAGGVDTRELSSQTMESRQPGLYFIGEVVDVTGWLGGYNFQWAWASGWACAQAMAASRLPALQAWGYNRGLCRQTPTARSTSSRGPPPQARSSCGTIDHWIHDDDSR